MLRAALVTTVVIGLAVTIGLNAAGERTPTLSEEGGPAISGAALPEGVDEGDDPAVGLDAPQVTGIAVDGSTVTLGRPHQAIVLMAPWCPACQAELPTIVTLDAAGGIPRGVELAIVATFTDDPRTPQPPEVWLRDAGWRGPALIDSTTNVVAEMYGIIGVPTWVLIDGDGRIAHRHTGMLEDDEIRALLATITP
jgi:cytochrome c biogenesis protein CcmG, thiol:disulfide interchange protein DsbE